eukprot:gene3816-4770_t
MVLVVAGVGLLVGVDPAIIIIPVTSIIMVVEVVPSHQEAVPVVDMEFADHLVWVETLATRGLVEVEGVTTAEDVGTSIPVEAEDPATLLGVQLSDGFLFISAPPAVTTAPNTKGQTGWTCASDNATPLTSVCLWAGVLCDGDGRVTDVLLGGLLLTGTIPSRIGLATSLTNIELDSNNLYGTLPSSLGRLVNLQYLDISVNSISRSIPNTIVNLQSLSYLVLSGNKLTGSVPSGLCTITSLNTLYVDNNPLTCYWNCMSTIASNNFPPTTSPRTKICSGSTSSWGGVACNNGNVVSILLSGLKLSGTIPTSIGLLSSLTTLLIGRNSIFSSIPSELGQLRSLVSLDLSANLITGSVPETLCSDSALTSLSFGSNSLVCYFNCLSSVPSLSAGAINPICSEGEIVYAAGYNSQWLSPSSYADPTAIYIWDNANAATAAAPGRYIGFQKTFSVSVAVVASVSCVVSDMGYIFLDGTFLGYCSYYDTSLGSYRINNLFSQSLSPGTHLIEIAAMNG